MSESRFVKSKLDEFFWEWLALPESQKIVRQAVQYAKGEGSRNESIADYPSPNFSALRGTASGRPSPPGSPHSGRLRHGAAADNAVEWPSTSPPSPGSPAPQASSPVGTSKDVQGSLKGDSVQVPKPDFDRAKSDQDEHRPLQNQTGTSNVIPRFWWPKRMQPVDTLPAESRQLIHEEFVKQGITEITTYQQLEPIVVNALGLSKYFTVPIFHKVKVFYDIVDASAKSKQSLPSPSPVPITEQMFVSWCNGKIQIDDPVLSFLWVVKMEHNQWIEREDFSIFLTAILLTHPGLDFLRETQEFQDRYADTVVSRIFFVYDRKDIGRIYLSDLRRYKPSVIETWKQLAEHDDIKMVRDYFSYEHFYVIYCTFWELDSDHDFLLDKDDLLKYDGHALSRRAIDRIFSEIPAKFTSAVPGRMGYEDFIRFLLCDQDRSTDRSVEYWFNLFDLDGDGCIRDHEMKYFYEEQVQRMECLNYETISFADIMCQMNDMIFPKSEGQFRLADFKRRRKFAGTFFSLFSSLNKFLTFEHRDPFLAKQEQLDNPSFSDWDRWCADEYLRLAMEEGDEPEEENTRTNDGFVDEVASRGKKGGVGNDASHSL
jgi:serine/threonine-protein phosphatase 2A regulatory subunit B''